MSYTKTLNESQIKNIKHILKSCEIKGITNRYAKAGILAVVSKESSFAPKSEIGYGNTPNDRIRKIFGSRLSRYNEAELNTLKANDEKFFNVVYGGMYGNEDSGDGYKYRGRGFNQLTFKANYKKVATDIGVDIVLNPDLMNTIEVASLGLIQYFVNSFKKMPHDISDYYGVRTLNNFINLSTAVNCIYHANAGWGKSVVQINSDPTGGLKKATERSESLLILIDNV